MERNKIIYGKFESDFLNICASHSLTSVIVRRAIFIKNIQNKCLLKEMHMV